MDKRMVDKRIEAQYGELPPALQRAARYAIDNPKSIALQSMRATAAKAGVQASAMHRLARQLGFEGYEALRTVYREWLARSAGSFAERATALQSRSDKAGSLARELVLADSGNLAALLEPAALEAISAASEILAQARRIYVGGLRSLFPAAFYFNYACGMFRQDTVLLSGIAGTFADDLRHAGPDDALLMFSYDPYARDAVSAVRFAHARGLRIVSVTDSVVSPIAAPASAVILVANATPSLFPSVVPALAVAQALVGLLVARGGQANLSEVEKSEAQLREFAVYTKDRC
ncbi:MurR/RpiR family transcriptional regulator [Bordetella avium]|uniref:MurR/RpiR family transcriptional regulator n=1 Tax=Bordetella avium TaxID=521 RepID=UPI000E0A8956|nr:MurR/RpiR family transcriptional regulator [Bordetella avium]AZY48148.1 MurR/RpiR family transcriptional regulator [Bordetella avium]AZY51528.1 MurR/RpiR family transcriptional regulator [Bordetella avium]RIQ14617.1 SIS domain-containing protein [Bordetella avium]RIQ16727.1 SIS domain-containing protein [Bordetella avium]RIQ35061.1 SIS domain-containing protein [Bordetella avium]